MKKEKKEEHIIKRLWAAWPMKPKIDPHISGGAKFGWILGSYIGSKIPTTPVDMAFGAYEHIKYKLFPPPPLPTVAFEHAEVLRLKAKMVYERYCEVFPDGYEDVVVTDIIHTHIKEMVYSGQKPIPEKILAILSFILKADLIHFAYDFTPQVAAAMTTDTIAGAKARDMMRDFTIQYDNPEAVLQAHKNVAGQWLHGFNQLLPDLPPFESTITISLADLIDLDQYHNVCIGCVHRSDVIDTIFFRDVREQLYRNQHKASGLPYPTQHHEKLKAPSQYGKSAQETVKAYFHGTWFEHPLGIEQPFPLSAFIPHHWMVTARTGSGKTQLLQTLILEQLKAPVQHGMIVIDNHGQMLEKIEALDIFDKEDRLVVVDVAAAPALNMFDYPQMTEEAEIEVLSLYNYIFSAIDAELTSRQGTAFSYIVRLMLATPRATIMTLLELIEEKVTVAENSKFWPIIKTLDPVAKAYFVSRFFSSSTKQTKEQLAARLYGVLRIRAFTRMFSAVENKLDMFDAMQKKKVVLINTKGLGEASNIFGRYMIAQALQAAFRRDTRKEPPPVILYVDEAYHLLDENINRILIEARKFGLFIRFATQHYDQIPQDVRSAAASNTEVKIAGGLSVDDARKLAPEFRTDADTMLSLKKVDYEYTEFMCYIQNKMDGPVKLKMPFWTLEKEPQTPPEALGLRRTAVRARLAPSVAPPPPPPPAANVAPPSPKPPPLPKKFPDKW